MAQRKTDTSNSNRILALATASLAGLLAVGTLAPQHAALAASADPTSSAATKPSAGEAILMNALDTELNRAMSSLGTDGGAAQQPKPYFLSYDVAEASNVTITAHYGAITNSSESRIRMVDVQVRLGTAAEDNTHGDHRNSALTTLPLPAHRRSRRHRALPLVRDQSRLRTALDAIPEGEHRAAGAREGRGHFRRFFRARSRMTSSPRRRRLWSSTAPRGRTACAIISGVPHSPGHSTPTR